MFSRNVKKENFPVLCFAVSKQRFLIKAYYQSARFADDIADTSLLSKETKLETLQEVRKAFMQPDKENNFLMIRELGRLFMQENLDASLFLDLLIAFERDAENKPVRIWEELIDYCRYSAAPVGRFMLAIYNENPSTYLPAENLCIILQLLNHLADIKNDLSLLGRCYIPEDIMKTYDVRISDFGLQITLPQVRLLLSDMMQKIEKMQNDAEILPTLIKNFHLRVQVCVILSLTNSVIKKYIDKDILQNPPRPNKLDWAKAIIKGFLKAMFCKYKPQGRSL